MNTDNKLAIPPDQMGAIEVRSQVNSIQYLMQTVLKEGEHFGRIPGVSKPSLMQSGAEKICFMFHLVPHYKVERESIEGMPGHREYTVTCTLSDQNGVVRGEAVASCSTMESRYRYRNVSDYEETGQPIPQDARERKQEYRKQGYGMKKINGQWAWVRYLDSAKQENPDIADTWNTCLQMAEKRAFVRATRSTTAASDIFTQDLDEQYMTAYEQYQQPVQPTQQMTDQEKAELRSITNAIAGDGDSTAVAREVLAEYRRGGMDAARAYRDAHMPEVIVEAEDFDF